MEGQQEGRWRVSGLGSSVSARGMWAKFLGKSRRYRETQDLRPET
jgi:hypothetical protein